MQREMKSQRSRWKSPRYNFYVIDGSIVTFKIYERRWNVLRAVSISLGEKGPGRTTFKCEANKIVRGNIVVDHEQRFENESLDRVVEETKN